MPRVMGTPRKSIFFLLVQQEFAFCCASRMMGWDWKCRAKPVTGMGLKIMSYRAGMIGAKFEIGSNVPPGYRC